MRTYRRAGQSLLGVLCVQLVIVLLVLAGWIQDIYKFAHCDFKAPAKAEIIYGVGLVPPLGMIIGWFNIDDTAPTE